MSTKDLPREFRNFTSLLSALYSRCAFRLLKNQIELLVLCRFWRLIILKALQFFLHLSKREVLNKNVLPFALRF